MAQAAFKGCHVALNDKLSFQIKFNLDGKRCCTYLGSFEPEQAASGARLYDAAQLLIRGPRADINFEWSSYTQADIQRAVEVLQAKGVDVHKAVVAAREGLRGTEWFGVRQRGPSWHAQWIYHDQQHYKHVAVQGLPSAEAAARQADCGFLAVRGMECDFTNLPASAYSQQQLQEAGEHAISKGAEAALIKKNLKAVEKVRMCCTFPPCLERSSLLCMLGRLLALMMPIASSVLPVLFTAAT
jgi:hypothetical protein